MWLKCLQNESYSQIIFNHIKCCQLFPTIWNYLFLFFLKNILTLSWRRSLSHRNQSINLLYKLIGWFLYGRDFVMKELEAFTLRYSVNKLFRKMSQNSQDISAMESFLVQLQIYTCKFSKIVATQVFLCEFGKFFRTAIPQNNGERLLYLSYTCPWHN